MQEEWSKFSAAQHLYLTLGSVGFALLLGCPTHLARDSTPENHGTTAVSSSDQRSFGLVLDFYAKKVDFSSFWGAPNRFCRKGKSSWLRQGIEHFLLLET